MKVFRVMAVLGIAVGAMVVPLPASAAPAAQEVEGLAVSVDATAACAEAQFSVSIAGGTGPYDLAVDFGDGELLAIDDSPSPAVVAHAYAAGGSYAWSVSATSGELSGQVAGTLVLGPSVTLTSDPFPPLLRLVEGGALVALTAEATGDDPLTYAWTLEGASVVTSDPSSPTANATYSAGGKYAASVVVTDACGLTAEDTLTIVVDDPLAEGCHPVAEWLANAVNTLYPGQSDQLYTCEDIYSYFTGGLTGSQLGFGTMRHAYALAETIPDLTWDEILDWKLDGSGWGLLVQLDRTADALGDVGIAELFARVVSGENSVQDIRTAARMSLRYEGDFEEALDLLAGGVANGELAQVYRAAEGLGVDPAVIVGYQELGVRAVELEQAARLAERLGTDWASVVEAHAAGESWGSIRRGEVEDTAGPGNSRGKGDGPKGSQGAEIQNEVNQRLAQQLAAKYGLTIEAVQAMYGTCGGDWGCVRTTLREQFAGQGRGRPNK